MQEIKISQLGEGLTEVRIITLFKNEGDVLDKDEPLLEVETDKAMMDIETPYAGRLTKWMVKPGDYVQVGSTVALVDGLQEANTNPTPTAKPTRNSALSPRDRARQKAAPHVESSVESQATLAKEIETANLLELSPRQAVLSALFANSQHNIAEASLTMRVQWDHVSQVCRQLRNLQGLAYRPAPPELIAWCITRVMKEHPQLRLVHRGKDRYETQQDVCIGHAVTLPNDELTVASVPSASSLDIAAFIGAMRRSIEDVRNGKTAAGGSQLVVSYMANHDVWHATPRILSPAVATLFIGSPYDVPFKAVDGGLEWKRLSNFVLTFDHRVINGVGAAAFLRDVAIRVKNLTSEF